MKVRAVNSPGGNAPTERTPEGELTREAVRILSWLPNLTGAVRWSYLKLYAFLGWDTLIEGMFHTFHLGNGICHLDQVVGRTTACYQH